MPKKTYLFLPIVVILSVLLFKAAGADREVKAQTQEQTGPNRSTSITVDVLLYDWWLANYADNAVVCDLHVEHIGLPKASEIFSACGESTYKKWESTQPCDAPEGGIEPACKGMYFQEVGSHTEQQQIQIDLPAPAVWLGITGCDFEEGKNRCVGVPSLHLSGEETLPNEQIIRIQGEIDQNPFSCPGNDCTLPLTPTGEQGITLTFWGASSFGDETEKYEALIRVVPWGDFMAPEGENNDPVAYYVDVISSQWKGDQISSCAAIWQVFPEVQGPPDWLKTPLESSGLNSSLSLHYLAAMLIQNGAVNAIECPSGGLDTPSTANMCGLEKATEALTIWQNQFDDEIHYISVDTGIPGQLIKNIFARESQLWPGIYQNVEEAGLGQLTEEGADAALLWNPDFYSQFCPLVISKETCDKGFGNLTEAQQSMLRGALVRKVNASCPDCPTGIDLSQANFSIKVFAETLLGNCAQVDRLYYNITRQNTNRLSSYNDLWRFTLINYNAGPGCLGKALERTWKANDPLDWEHVAANLDPACRGGVDYVREISDGETAEISVYSTPLPSPTPTRIPPTATVTPTRTPTPTQTPTLTATATATEITPDP